MPEEYGGLNMGMLAKAVVIEELKTSIVPFVLPPDSPIDSIYQYCDPSRT